MRKCIILPDSFKGTMSALRVCEIMKKCILQVFPNCEVIAIPVADGGEGTVDCFLQALGGRKVKLQTSGPFMENIESFYGITEDNTAIIEMAAAAGLPLAAGKLDPEKASTYGVGELIYDAAMKGCKRIILGLGGSCTNDGGAGMAAALGTKFYDEYGVPFIPVGGTLSQVFQIDISETTKLLKGIEIIAMCDIDNPMYGENGAALIFAPQKGADEKIVARLEQQLRCFSHTIHMSLGIDVSELKGAGAAGAMGAGVYAFLGAALKRGIEIVLDLVDFDTLLTKCDYVFTGEGRLDRQSLSGKVVMGVSGRAKAKHVPVIAVVGSMEKELKEIYDMGVTAVYETSSNRKTMDEIKMHCEEDLETIMKEILLKKIPNV